MKRKKPRHLILQGDCIKTLRSFRANSVHAVVTDPPYGWRFMGKAWDGKDIERVLQRDRSDGDTKTTAGMAAGKYERSDQANVAFQLWTADWAREVFRVLKPGGHMLVFCGPRTYHRMASGVEDAGFEVRDQLQWLFGSGFPKSLNIAKAGGGKSWEGWGTALKPANEPILLARKPLSEGTVAGNVLKHGTGGLNIDAGRIEGAYQNQGGGSFATGKFANSNRSRTTRDGLAFIEGVTPPQGRFPANLLLSHNADCLPGHCTESCAVGILDAQSIAGGMHGAGAARGGGAKQTNEDGALFGMGNHPGNGARHGDTGGASRFFRTFYCPKPARRERNEGLVDGAELIEVFVDTWGKQDQRALLRVDTAQSPPRVIGVSGTLSKSVSEWNTVMFGRKSSEKSQPDSKSTTRTETSSITESKTLNWLLRSSTNATIQDAKSSTGNGGSPAAHAKHLSLSLTITKDEMAIVTNASDAPSTGRLLIRELDESAASKPLLNTHCTVKPIKLMQYLITLITPPNGLVLDPFAGSGSTGVAAAKLGFRFIGIEQEREYVKIARARVRHAKKAA